MKYFVKSDWNGFFGLFTNNLTNVLVMASLLSVVVGLPNSIVFGRIIPAVGFSIFLASSYYTFMAVKLSKKENRSDVTSLPSGTSVPHMFLVVFLVIGPVYWATGDAYLAWAAGVVWALIEGIIELLGSLFGEQLRNFLPRAAMLGSLAGVSITYIALNPAFSVWSVPYIGLVALAIILLGFVGNLKMPFNIPVGLVAIIIGVIIGWVSGVMNLETLFGSLNNLSIGVPVPSITRYLDGFESAIPFLVAAIPLGIYNFFETIDNCESAAVAGDEYSTKEALLADGLTTIIGSLFGNPFPTAVFIGHPGWKKAGARIGYAALTGFVIFMFSIFGLIGLLLAIIPLASILPILLYIGIVITTQAFNSVEAKYAPAVVLAIIPWMADWTRNAVDIALGEASTNAGAVGYDVLSNAGLDYFGMLQLGTGSIVVGILLGTIAVFIIDHKLIAAGYTAFIAAGLSFVGIIHGSILAYTENLPMTIGYGLMGLIFILFQQFNIGGENAVETD